jgi:murein DD-endopeptidase MepM/ murein hydrolase activator NlpD
VNALGYTSAAAADFYRGRQVWIRHDNGLISRFAHLSAIDEGVTVGARVAAGDPLGEVGNSGSPASLSGPAEDAHLHIEFWFGAQFLGQYMRPAETREWLLAILTY